MNILQWLNNQGYDYTWNVKIGDGKPDVTAFKDDEVAAIEIKKYVNEIPEAIKRCASYKNCADKVYIILPMKEIEKMPKPFFNTLKKRGIGLVQANENIEVLIEPSCSKRSNKSLIEELRRKSLSPTSNGKVDVEKKIEEILRTNSDGLSITEISRILKIHRHTIVKYIQRLVRAGVIYQRNVGPAKLFYIKDKGEGK